MAVTEEVAGWSKTAGSNGNIDSGINAAEGQTPGSVNNGVRGVMAAIKKWHDDTGGQITTAGTANAQTLTTNQVIDTLADGLRVHFVAGLTNTGATTLAVDSTGAKAVRKLILAGSDAALAGYEILTSGHYIVQYDASANGAAGAWVLLNPNPLPSPGELYGLTLSNNGSDAVNDIDIAAGTAANHSNTVRMVLASAITKRIDASWAVGTNQGGLDGTESVAGTPDTSTWYHMYLIMRADTGVVDAIFSENASAPTLPTNYTHYRLIGSVYNTSGGDIRAFTQYGRRFYWNTLVADVSANTLGTSAVTRTLSVPTGRVVRAIVQVINGNAAGAGSISYMLITPLATTDETPSITLNDTGGTINAAGGSRTISSEKTVDTNTSAQVRSRASVSSVDVSLTINTRGWDDFNL